MERHPIHCVECGETVQEHAAELVGSMIDPADSPDGSAWACGYDADTDEAAWMCPACYYADDD